MFTEADIEKMLRLAAEQQKFSAPDDALSQLLAELDQDDGELDIEDMEYVAAAGQTGYRSFLARANDPNRRHTER